MQGTYRAGRLVARAASTALVAAVLLNVQAAIPAPAIALVRSLGPSAVSADALPTVQIDGVVWTQVIVGNTVYAGGAFRSARPAGVAPGSKLQRRWNILAYDIRSGRLIKAFAPRVNGLVRTLAVAPDHRTLYVGGDFTEVNGHRRSRFAVFHIPGQVLLKAAPRFNASVRAIVATASRVYVGGSFTRLGKLTRFKLASVRARSGSALPWAPRADNYVRALTLTPDRTRVVVGGSFGTLNGRVARGMGSLDARSGASRPWKINTVVKDFGASSAIMSLTADKTTVYGSGFSYGPAGNFEGAFAAEPKTGNVRWLQDCHGDTYDVASVKGVLYSVGHAHDCSNIGGFGESKPVAYRAMAVSTLASATVARNTRRPYVNFGGRPAPALFNWFPALTPGTFTGQGQAAWSIEANGSYVVMGGEFIRVNGVAQQGLVRFAVRSKAPNRQGPGADGSRSVPLVQPRPGEPTTITWQASSDRDDQLLTYQLIRDGAVISTSTAVSQFWNHPVLRAADRAMLAGDRRTYQVRVTDPTGNVAISAPVRVIA